MLNRKRLLLLLGAFILTFCVRVLTLQFMRAHLDDPGWFQVGSYAKFDRQARDILDGRQKLFWIDDSTRTDLVQYPPAFPALVALVYKLSGERSVYVVQSVQWIVDLIITFGLVVGMAATAFGWRAAIATSFVFALSPVFAMYGAYPSADTPATWFVLGGSWLLLLAAKRTSVWLALGAGLLLGIACWFRVNPLYLCVAWAIALLWFVKTATWRRRLLLAGGVVLGTVLVVAPIVIRNYLVFPDFTPTGGTIGTNLWEGLGEAELGRSHGFVCADADMLERERIKLGSPAPVDMSWPDGIRRDRERSREAMAFIKQHPVWYAGVVLKRMWGMVKIAGDPVPYTGTSGINVTSAKCLSPARQDGVIAAGVNLLGMIQSVARYLFLPLVAFGIYIGLRREPWISGLLLATVVYYLGPGTIAHTELRYVVPLHGVLIVLAGRVFGPRI